MVGLVDSGAKEDIDFSNRHIKVPASGGSRGECKGGSIVWLTAENPSSKDAYTGKWVTRRGDYV